MDIAERDLQDSPILWYLTEYCGWLPTLHNTGSVPSWTGRCLWHQERSGSLTVYPDHLHCYGGGCGIHSDLAQLIGVQEFGLDFADRISSGDVFVRRDALLKEFEKGGGLLLPGKDRVGHGLLSTSTRTQKALSVPGPLQRMILNRLTQWWHTQLLTDTKGAKEARAYLDERGVSPWMIELCPVLGYMPNPADKDVHWKIMTNFDALFRVTENDLEKERQWYRARIPWETLTDEHLFFLRTPKTFAIRLGVHNERGAYRLQDRLIFSCKNGIGETRFYQSRVLPGTRKGSKFLNPPGMKKYPFQVNLPMVSRPGITLTPHVPGTLLTESPFGPLVALSWSLCSQAIATLGEGSPSRDQLAGLREPVWLAQDNDEAQIQESRRGPALRKRIAFPGEEQARLYAAFFAEQQQVAYRLKPWKQNKGLDEWINQNEGARPVVDTMRQILDAQRRIA